MTTQVTDVNAKQPTEQQPTDDPKFDQAMDKAQQQVPDANQLAQMGVMVMSPMIMSHVQEIIGEALGGEE